eukprot:6783418-Pyramimonas_sp.AAC.1
MESRDKSTPGFNDLMRETSADVVLLQEHKLHGALYRRTVARLQRAGWRIFGCECIKSESGHPSGGTFICTRKHYDAWVPPGESAELWPGRVARAFFRS